MRYVVLIVLAYFTAVLAATAAIQYFARVHPPERHLMINVNGQFELVVDRDVPLPFWLDGHGRAPGEVSVINSRGIVLDSERIDDVYTVNNVRWEEFKVHFDFDQDGKFYESSLAFEP